jgi:rfaE bifunctional protein kinase chain/domain
MKIEKVAPAKVSRARIQAILKAISGRKVLVIGDVGVDRYTTGLVERISPEAPVPIVLVEEEKLKLGLAANVADNVQALGGIPLLVGVVGKDRAAQDFKGLLRAAGIRPAHLVTDPKRRTVLKERIVSDRQQLLRVDYETHSQISGRAHRDCLAEVKRLIDRVDAVVIEDYAKGLVTEKFSEVVRKTVTASGKILSADPNAKSPVSLYKGAHVLTPNTKEAERLSGIPIRDEASLVEAGTRILEVTGAKHIVVTRGKDGMAIFTAVDKVVRLIPTYAREVYDVSGAGDTVIAALTLALAAGASIVEASVLGNIAAGIEVGKRGTATVSPAEILESLNGR